MDIYFYNEIGNNYIEILPRLTVSWSGGTSIGLMWLLWSVIIEF